MTPKDARPVYLFMIPWSLRHIGGVNQVVVNLAAQMKAAAVFDPVVLTADWDAVDPAWYEVDGVAALRLRLRPYPSRWRDWVTYLAWETRCRAKLRALFRGRRIVAINPHFVGPLAMTLRRLVRLPVPMLLSFHGSDVAMLGSGSRRSIDRWRRFLAQASALVACSNSLGREVMALFEGALPHTIHNGLDVDRFVSMAGDACAGKSRVILSVAMFMERKGQDILIDAFATLVADYPDVTLHLAGYGSSNLPRLLAMCERHGVADLVTFSVDVPHDEVARLFAEATVFALPSRQEPFGITVLEAGAFALPVVASRVGGTPEILNDGVNGRLVSPDDSRALADALRAVLDDPVSAKAMGARLHDEVRRTFTWQAAESAYARLTAGDRPL